jgi:simple sugar transport system permease protein
MAAPAAAAAHRRRTPEWLEGLVGQLAALLLALVIALAIGSVIIVLYDESPAKVYGAIIEYSFGDAEGFGYVLVTATPLIFSALATAVCFKGGMFNIGVEGQYIVAMAFAAAAALWFDFLPGPLLMWASIAAAMIGGMTWGLIPGLLKVKTGAHEVVTTIMLNGVAVSLVAWMIGGPLRYEETGGGYNVNLRTDPFAENAMIPDLGHLLGIRESVKLSWLFPAAVVTALIVWFIMRRMRLGFEARAVGSSPGSAQAGGISIGGTQIRLFLLSGALAGLAGLQQLLGDQGFLPVGYEAALGFIGIGVAFLGQNNPIGIIFAAILWGVLARGETALQIETDVPREFVIILQGLLIMTVVITYQIAKRRLLARQLRRAAEIEQAPPPSGPMTGDVEVAA